MTYDFPLRAGLVTRLTLPVDLSRSEALRLNRFVSAVAFPDDYLIVDAVIHHEDCESGTCGGECDVPEGATDA